MLTNDLLEPLGPDEHPAVARAWDAAAEISDEYAAELAARTEFPDDLWQLFAKHRLHGLGAAEQVGGEPADLLVKMRVAEILSSRVDMLTWVWGITNCFAIPIVDALADADVAAGWLAEICAGQRRFAFGITEPGGGSDLFGALRTTVDPSTGAVHGVKRYCTGAASADHLLVLARERGAPEGGTSGLTFCVVPTRGEGVHLERIPTPSYASVFGTYQVTLDGAIAEHVWSGPAVREVLRTVLVQERLIIPVIASGAATMVIRKAIEYGNRREAFGQPVASYQGLQHMVADAVMDLEVARHYTYAMARRVVDGQPLNLGADAAKSRTTDAAFRVADAAMQLMGGIGYTTWGGIEHIWRALRVFRLAPISEELVRNRVARGMGMGDGQRAVRA